MVTSLTAPSDNPLMVVLRPLDALCEDSMHIIYKILLIIHISAAAVTLGASTGLLRNLRRTLEAGKATFALAAEDALRRGKIMGVSSFMVLWTGISLIFVRGGFKAVPVPYHIALVIMLGAITISLTIMRPTSAQIVVLSTAETLDKDGISKKLKKLAMGQGILHLSWLTMLILMFVSR